MWLQTQFVPNLKNGDIVIMDNLATHKIKTAREIIEKAGAKILYLPLYSPDFNPIEMAFAKIKAMLRKAGERTIVAVCKTLGDILKAFTAEECRNYTEYSGYVST